MSTFLRTAALMLLVLSRAPAFAATLNQSDSTPTKGKQEQNEVCPSVFKHSLSGLYGIDAVQALPSNPITILTSCTAKPIRLNMS